MAKKEPTQEEVEAEVVEVSMALVKEAKALFGDNVNLGMLSYLKAAEDEEDLARDYTRAKEHAKAVFEVDPPTPEQVYWMFEELYG
jgi:hypothetical protein